MEQPHLPRQASSNAPVNPFSRPRTVIMSNAQRPHIQDGQTTGEAPHLRSASLDRTVPPSNSSNHTPPSNLTKDNKPADPQSPSTSDGTPTLTEPLSLQQFGTTYASRLPLTAVVHSGEYQDRNLHVTIGVKDKVHLQHLQNVRVVKLQGVLTKHNFTVPLSSNTYLSLLYTASSETIHGSLFKKVSNLMTAKPLPKVVCATKAWSNSSVSIRNPEILVPIERVQNGSSDGILMFSLLDREEKFLPESCAGHFDTSPKMVSMLLQDVIAHVPRVFSSTAYIDDPSRSNNKYVMIMGMDLEVTIKCTTVDRQNGMSHEMDLPLSAHSLKLCVTEWGSGSGTTVGTSSPAASPVPAECPPTSDPSLIGPLVPLVHDSYTSSLGSVNSSNSITSSQEHSPPMQRKLSPPPSAPSQLTHSHGSLPGSSDSAPTIPPRGPTTSPTLSQRRVAIPPESHASLPLGHAPSLGAEGGKGSNAMSGDAVEPRPPQADDFVASSPMLTLLELVRQYQTSLPVHVRVQGGHHTTPTTSQPELLTVNHVRYLEVMGVATSDGSMLDVPLGTGIRFSLLYNPTQDLKEAIKGFLFKGVPALVSTSPRPLVVWVKEGWVSESVAVEKDEILLPRKYRPDQEALPVYSLWTRTEKLLPLACTAVFSSNANHTMLDLCDIASSIPSTSFPCKACILKEGGAKCLPSNVVTLTGKTVAPILVCSLLLPSQGGVASSDGLPPATYYIPLTLPHIQVVVVERSRNNAGTRPSNGADGPGGVVTPPPPPPPRESPDTGGALVPDSDDTDYIPDPMGTLLMGDLPAPVTPVNESPLHSTLDNIPMLQPPPDFDVEALSDEDEDRHLTVSL